MLLNHRLEDNIEIGLSRTVPIAFCGNYSCLEGVISADISVWEKEPV